MSDTHEIKGTIKLIEDTKEFSSGFKKREFVITTDDGKYPQDIKFEVLKDKCDSMDQFSVGDSVDVSFNIKGNEYNGSYYVNLQCWRIAKDGAGQQQQPHPPQQQATPGTMQNSVDDGQDIPFGPIS